MTPEERLARYARLAVEVGCQPPAGPAAARQPATRAPAVRPRDRRGRLRARGEVRRGDLRRSARPAVADPPRAGGHARLVAALDALAGRRVRDGARRLRSRSRATPSRSSSPTSTATRERQGAAAPRRREDAKETGDGKIAWTIVGYPNAGWARGGVRRAGRRAALGRGRGRDAPRRGRPGRAWRAHIEKLAARAAMLDERGFDAIRFRGPGTDLTVGLIPSVALGLGLRGDVDVGIEMVVNMPTEEVFTTPDRLRTEGSRPLDDAARRQRADRARPRDALRGRARHRGDGRRTAPTSSGRRWRPTRAGRCLGEVVDRRRRLARPADRHRLLRHALRRERGLPHRLRRGLHEVHRTAARACRARS